MESTRRGLELTRTEWVSDTERFYRVVKDAARDAASELQREIGYGNPGNFVIYANQIAAIAELWFWARDVSCNYKDTPAVLIAVPKHARHIDEWRESMGPVLWWRDGTDDHPYVGTPLDTYFDDSYLWWSPIDIPEIPESETRE